MGIEILYFPISDGFGITNGDDGSGSFACDFIVQCLFSNSWYAIITCKM